MELKVLFSEDPGFVIRRADKFLSSKPVLHNLILSILHSRVAQRDPGRYWIALHGEEAVGVVVQSPLEYPATLTPMEPRAVLAIVDAIAEAGVSLAGVNGDAATAARFAGQWSERRKSAATPFQGTRLYELLELGEVPPTVGHLRQAGPRDRRLMIVWTRAFQDEIGESADDTERRVDRALPSTTSGSKAGRPTLSPSFWRAKACGRRSNGELCPCAKPSSLECRSRMDWQRHTKRGSSTGT